MKNNVLPGWIDSLPATDERRQSSPAGAARHGPAEIAATISFLASDGVAGTSPARTSASMAGSRDRFEAETRTP